MYEEGGGWWNRFDMEYSFTDNLIGTAELNQYWGDEDTQFDSSRTPQTYNSASATCSTENAEVWQLASDRKLPLQPLSLFWGRGFQLPVSGRRLHEQQFESLPWLKISMTPLHGEDRLAARYARFVLKFRWPIIVTLLIATIAAAALSRI